MELCRTAFTHTHTHTHTHTPPTGTLLPHTHLVTARVQMVVRKQPATIIHPQPPSGGVTAASLAILPCCCISIFPPVPAMPPLSVLLLQHLPSADVSSQEALNARLLCNKPGFLSSYFSSWSFLSFPPTFSGTAGRGGWSLRDTVNTKTDHRVTEGSYVFLHTLLTLGLVEVRQWYISITK